MCTAEFVNRSLVSRLVCSSSLVSMHVLFEYLTKPKQMRWETSDLLEKLISSFIHSFCIPSFHYHTFSFLLFHIPVFVFVTFLYFLSSSYLFLYPFPPPPFFLTFYQKVHCLLLSAQFLDVLAARLIQVFVLLGITR